MTENNPPVWNLEVESTLVFLDPSDPSSLLWRQNYAEKVFDED
jgi:hypothetical protein